MLIIHLSHFSDVLFNLNMRMTKMKRIWKHNAMRANLFMTCKAEKFIQIVVMLVTFAFLFQIRQLIEKIRSFPPCLMLLSTIRIVMHCLSHYHITVSHSHHRLAKASSYLMLLCALLTIIQALTGVVVILIGHELHSLSS